MSYIKDTEINAIREQADIVDILSDYIHLEQKGKNYWAKCPFHGSGNERTPSFAVSRERQTYYCFSCKKFGNVFSFIMEYENVGYVEAIKIVADKIGYKLSGIGLIDKPVANKDLYDIMSFVKMYFLNNLFTESGINARKYLENRGIDEKIIREFNIGLAPQGKNTLYNFLTKKGYSEKQLDEIGLINKVGIDIYDAFTNRIMIPIEDLKGQVVGFTGRVFNGEEDTAKYINSKETIIFKKSNILFNYHNAKNAIRESKMIIVVEGNMDAIKLSASGIKNVVALMGVALSKIQIETIAKLKVPIVLMLDNDSAGLTATLKNGDLLEEEKLDVRVVRLTGAKDPDEYIRIKGLDAIRDNINHAQKFIDFKLNYFKEGKNLDNVDDLRKYIKEVLNSINKTDDLTKSVIISKISKDYAIDIHILQEEIGKSKETVPRNVPIKEEKKRLSKYHISASKVLYHMMNDSKYVTIYKNRLGYFKEKVERIVASEIVYYNNEHNINIADFISYLIPQEELNKYVTKILSENINTVISEEEFNNCIDVILKILKKDEIKELKEKIKNEMDVNKKVELIAKLTEIKKEV